MKEKGRFLKVFVTVLIMVVLSGFGGLGYYLYQQAESGVFFNDTKINGYDVSGLTCKQILLNLGRDYSAPTIKITEKGEEALLLIMEEAGYTVDETGLLSNIQKCMTDQKTDLPKLIFSLMEGNSYEISVPFIYDENVFLQNVNTARLAQPRVSSTDAYLDYNEEEKEYFIVPETYGNEFDDADLQIMVADAAKKMSESKLPAENAEIVIPESFYFLPEITSENEDMNLHMNVYNTYCKAKITTTFGSKTKEVLDWDTIQDWIMIEDGQGILLEESVQNYVQKLAEDYNTLYYEREFKTSDGNTITFSSNDYGYRIDQDAEVAQLVQDIYNNTEIAREPVYSVKGYTREGRDDLCGTYVEANLSRQHLWFYKNGNLVIETDFVSGLPTKERETVTGVFCIPYKKSPEVLKGDTWEEEVTYWMPFYDGQGLHDAPWRSSFGGGIYQSNGSHGCINLPADAARIIYDNMEERIAIFIYK